MEQYESLKHKILIKENNEKNDEKKETLEIPIGKKFYEILEDKRKEYMIRKESYLDLSLESMRNKKVPISEVLLDIKDISGAVVFFFVLNFLLLANVSLYVMYLTLPALGYLIARYLMGKIKIQDYKKIKYYIKNKDKLIQEDFEKEIADHELLSLFKKEYGENALENILINKLNENNEKFIGNIRIVELESEAQKLDKLKYHQEKIKEAISVI